MAVIKDEAFLEFVQFVFKWEGGYVNDPNDSGGATKYGITKRWYPHLDIKNLTKEEAMDIYYKDYWLRAGCDKKFYPCNLLMFDTSVHMGIFRAKQIAEASLSWQDFILRRIEYYTKIPSAQYYLKGWINRCLGLWKEIKSKGGH